MISRFRESVSWASAPRFGRTRRRRTGHTSSALERYRRVAGTLPELNIGDWTTLDQAIPELRDVRPSSDAASDGYALFLCGDFFNLGRGISVGRSWDARSWDAESASSDLGSVRAPASRVKRSELSETPSADASRESCA
jgi:hypothetical protein